MKKSVSCRFNSSQKHLIEVSSLAAICREQMSNGRKESRRMKRLKMGILACILAMLPALLTATVTGTAYAASQSCGAWSIIKSPNPGHEINIINGTATVSANDVWAVGTADQSSTTGLYQTLTEHWNGTSWSVVKSPDVGIYSNYLYGVTAISSSNVWAVGYYFPTIGIPDTLIEHWNGSVWSVVKSPNPSPPGIYQSNYLYGVAAASANDIWAVGQYANSSGVEVPLVEHWNGSAWSVVKSPSPGGSYNILQSVAVVSSNDVWAVGFYYTSHDQALAEHWNGTSWSIVQTPSLGFEVHNWFKGVTVVSSSNVWAVGFHASGTQNKTLIEQWNGTKWSVVKSPNVVSDNYLNAVVAISANNIWAVGGSGTVNSNVTTVYTANTLTEQWNGTSWNIVKSANPGTGANSLYAVAALDATHVWTAGTQGPSNNWSNYTLTEFYC